MHKEILSTLVMRLTKLYEDNAGKYGGVDLLFLARVAFLQTLIGLLRVDGILVTILPQVVIFFLWINDLISYRQYISFAVAGFTGLVSVLAGSIVAHIIGEIGCIKRRIRVPIWGVVSFALFAFSYNIIVIGLLQHESDMGAVQVHATAILTIVFVVVMISILSDEPDYFYDFVANALSDRKIPRMEGLYRKDLISVQSANQYIVLRFEGEEEKSRMKFSEALEILKDVKGCQIHRTFWVSADHLSDPIRNGKTWRMTVEGHNLPVSNRYLENIHDLIRK